MIRCYFSHNTIIKCPWKNSIKSAKMWTVISTGWEKSIYCQFRMISMAFSIVSFFLRLLEVLNLQSKYVGPTNNKFVKPLRWGNCRQLIVGRIEWSPHFFKGQKSEPQFVPHFSVNDIANCLRSARSILTHLRLSMVSRANSFPCRYGN